MTDKDPNGSPFRIQQIGPLVSVVKAGEEGGIEIDSRTGIIATAVDNRPDWADGLACAMLAERVGYYASRTGRNPPIPAVLECGDLEWVAIAEDGTELVIEASAEIRQENLAAMIGVDRETGEHLPNTGKVTHEREIAMDNRRPAGEPALLDAESRKSFGEVDTAEAADKKTATGG